MCSTLLLFDLILIQAFFNVPLKKPLIGPHVIEIHYRPTLRTGMKRIQLAVKLNQSNSRCVKMSPKCLLLDFEHAYSECPLCTFFVSQNNILLLSFAAFASVKLQRKTLVRWETPEHNWIEYIM